jgi:hypothetical protein
MIRDRAWRRYMEERIVIRRMTRAVCTNNWWHLFKDINDINHKKPTIAIYVGTEINFRAKTHTTTKWDTNHKVKYSPNKGKTYWRDDSSKNRQTRESDKRTFLRILKENGLK